MSLISVGAHGTNREDKTEKHFLVFLYLVFDRDLGRKKRGQDSLLYLNERHPSTTD